MIGLHYHHNSLTLSSGNRSHWYVNAQEMFDHEGLQEEVLRIWERTLTNGPYQFEGVPRGGLPWAQAIHNRFSDSILRPLNSEPEPDFWRIVVDDVVTTGRSIMDVSDMRLHRRLAVVIRGRPAYEWFNSFITYWMYIKLDEFPAWQKSVPEVGKG